MYELSQILEEADRLRASTQSFALATVVKINGSTYRRPGARMLISPEGKTVGTISGGCLEQEVAQRAFTIMEEGVSQVLPFDLSDDDLILGFGTGCNGVVHVLIEPIPVHGRLDPIELIETCLTQRRMGVLATIVEAGDASSLSRHLLLTDDGFVRHDITGDRLRAQVQAAASGVLEDGRTQVREIEDTTILFEIVHPRTRLVIFGQGHDVMPLVRMAGEMGWSVTVVGNKPDDVLAKRFPEADEVVFLMHPETVREYVELDRFSAAVVMNHHFLRDKRLIGALLKEPVRYVGALGPRERSRRIRDELLSEDDALSASHFENLYGPVGLDIGTETPHEIALSIVAEVQAVMHGRSGGQLRARPGRIHREVPVV